MNRFTPMSNRTASPFLTRLMRPNTLLLTLLLVFANSTGCDLGTYENRAAEVISSDDETSEGESEAENPDENEAQKGEESQAPDEN